MTTETALDDLKKDMKELHKKTNRIGETIAAFGGKLEYLATKEDLVSNVATAIEKHVSACPLAKAPPGDGGAAAWNTKAFLGLVGAITAAVSALAAVCYALIKN